MAVKREVTIKVRYQLRKETWPKGRDAPSEVIAAVVEALKPFPVDVLDVTLGQEPTMTDVERGVHVQFTQWDPVHGIEQFLLSPEEAVTD